MCHGGHVRPPPLALVLVFCSIGHEVEDIVVSGKSKNPLMHLKGKKLSPIVSATKTFPPSLMLRNSKLERLSLFVFMLPRLLFVGETNSLPLDLTTGVILH